MKQDWTKIGKGMGRSGAKYDPTTAQVTRSLMPWGPRELGLGLTTANQGSGPGEPPAGFVGGTTSKTEWYVYWALEKILGPEGYTWSYQQSYQGGRHVPGGSVVDFVIYNPKQTILCDVQTWEFHFAQGSQKMSRDFEQREGLGVVGGEEIVVNVYEQYFINDPSGKAVMSVMLDCIAGVEWPSPVSTGIAGDW